MTGDGANDSHALMRANVDVAGHGSTDAAKAAAGLSTIVEGIPVSRSSWCCVRSFLAYRIAATQQLLCFSSLARSTRSPNPFANRL